jgi:Cu+-exporting ATPase
VKTVAFDKTGTLTTGRPRLSAVHLAANAEPKELAAIVRTLVADSSHPLAATLLVSQFCSENAVVETMFDHIRHLPGRGVTAIRRSDRQAVYLGNRRWLEAEGQDCSGFPEASDSAEALIAWGGQARGQFQFAEELRGSVKETLADLRQAGLQLLMLTGDREPSAKSLAESLHMKYCAELLPEEKLEALRCVPAAERPLAMVGDGINDAPALAAADVGISLASGTDIARNSAAICLLRNDLQSLPFLHRLARRTVQGLHWNLVWAFLYNIIGLSIAASGWLHPVIAAVAMGASGLFVVLNSLSLARFESVDRLEELSDERQGLPHPRRTDLVLPGEVQ